MTLEQAYEMLVKETEPHAKQHWVYTGSMPPQENAIVAFLFMEIQNLKEKLASLEK